MILASHNSHEIIEIRRRVSIPVVYISNINQYSLFTMATDQNELVQVSIPLPRSLDTRIFIRLATQAKALVLSLTTASQEELGAPRPMGSFVYALPDVSSKPL